MKNKTKTIKEINSEFVEWADKYVDMKNKVDISKVGNYSCTKDGVVKDPDKIIKVKIGYDYRYLRPCDNFYNTFKNYGKYEEIDEVVFERMMERWS
ncbi:MAG: hypothetical protein US85_C0016G0019 [Candidatus Shapirobacteria bacterium GW2011_GWF1_38_23]|nr:MAG: hypothetical protein US85_C0016G0019 [Candidatus Shapirobacteria bacterium GW2011_GWF1_38_23]